MACLSVRLVEVPTVENSCLLICPRVHVGPICHVQAVVLVVAELVARVQRIELLHESVCVLLMLKALRSLATHVKRLQLGVHKVSVLLESALLQQLPR